MQRQQPPTERRQGQPLAATKKAKAATATKKVLSPPLTFGVVLFFPLLPWEGGGTVATSLRELCSSCSLTLGFGVGLPSWEGHPQPQEGSKKKQRGTKKEGFPNPGKRPRIRRKVNPNAPPPLGGLPSSLPCTVVLLSLLLLPIGLPSPSFLELGLPTPTPKRRRQEEG